MEGNVETARNQSNDAASFETYESNAMMLRKDSISLPNATEKNLITISCGGTPSHDWTVSIVGSHFGLLEWPSSSGAECSILVASHTLSVPVGAFPVVAAIATLSLAIIIAALAYRSRHRYTLPTR